MRHLLAIATLALALGAAGRASAEPDWTVQVDPLTALLGFTHVQVERRIGDHASVYLGPSLRLYSSPLLQREDYLGLGGEAGVRWYVLGTSPRGWWGLVRGVAARLSTEVDGTTRTAPGGYASVLGGYTWILGDFFVLSAGAGVQYFAYTVADVGLSGVLPALHTTFGFAF